MSFLQPITAALVGRPWMQGLAVIGATFVLASLLTWIISVVLRAITRRTRFSLDDHIATILRPPLYYSLLVTGVSTGITLMPLSGKVYLILISTFKSIGVLVWAFFFFNLSSLILNRLALMSGRFSLIQPRTLTLFDNGARVIIFGLAIHFIFMIWQIDMTAWLASAGIAGMAVGFAAKDTLANLFSGVFILADAPYKIGDYIVLDTGERGKVTHIGLRSTRLLTRDDVEITIPNSIMGNSKITNQSGGPHEKFRIRVKVGVAYGTDIDLLRRLLLEIAASESLVCKSPAPRVRFRLFNTSSIDFELLCWAKAPALRGRTMDKLNDAIYKRLDQEGIEIPYPKQDVYIQKLPVPVPPKELAQGSLDRADEKSAAGGGEMVESGSTPSASASAG